MQSPSGTRGDTSVIRDDSMLVPISPKTTPKAPRSNAARTGCSAIAGVETASVDEAMSVSGVSALCGTGPSGGCSSSTQKEAALLVTRRRSDPFPPELGRGGSVLSRTGVASSHPELQQRCLDSETISSAQRWTVARVHQLLLRVSLAAGRGTSSSWEGIRRRRAHMVSRCRELSMRG
jgi:hypothetical protein